MCLLELYCEVTAVYHLDISVVAVVTTSLLRLCTACPPQVNIAIHVQLSAHHPVEQCQHIGLHICLRAEWYPSTVTADVFKHGADCTYHADTFCSQC